MVQLRNAPRAAVSPVKPQSKRSALKEKTNTTRAKIAAYDDDDIMESLVKDAKAKRGRSKKGTHNEDDLVMTGALPPEDTAVDALRSDAPVTAEELATHDPPVHRNIRRPPRMTRKLVQSEAQSKVLEGLKKRMETTARQEADKQRDVSAMKEARITSSDIVPAKPATAHPSESTTHERSGLSLSPSPPPAGDINVSRNNHSSLAQTGSKPRPQGTPAVENSILALKNFKRRPRQPSMLQMVQERLQNARPSIANANAHEDLSVFDVEDDEGDEDDEDEEDAFAPEAEGTPLHVSKTKARVSTSAKKRSAHQADYTATSWTASSAQKRGLDAINTSLTALDALRAKRRKSGAIAMADDAPLPSLLRSSPNRRSSVGADVVPEVQVIHSSPFSSSPPSRDGSVEPDAVVPSTEEWRDAIETREHQTEKLADPHASPNETVAQPMSSSPLPANSLTLHHPEELADPVTQVSPTPPERPKARKEKTKPISTATLQSLLPKRRRPLKPRHRKTEYDFTSGSEDEDAALDTSHLEEDEDELGGRLRRRVKTTPAKRRKTTTAKTTSKQSKTTQRSRKAAAAQARKSIAQKPHRTYGRRVTSDKENEHDNDEPDDDDENEGDDTALPELSMHAAAQSTELEEAKRKFAEVDEWDMEFESMSVEDHRSSSLQWR